MRTLMDILEDERTLLLKLDTIRQNEIRYGGAEAQEVLRARKEIVKRNLNDIRKEIREYIEGLFTGGEDHE